MWNLLKVNNKDNRKTSMTSFWGLYCELWADFKHFSGVFIVDFEQVTCQLRYRLLFFILLTWKLWKIIFSLLFFSLWASIINNASIKTTKTSEKHPARSFSAKLEIVPLSFSFVWSILLTSPPGYINKVFSCDKLQIAYTYLTLHLHTLNLKVPYCFFRFFSFLVCLFLCSFL